MIPNRLYFSACFPDLPRPVEDVWETLVAVLMENRCLPKKFSMSQIAGHREEFHSRNDLILRPDEIRQIIVDRELNGFYVDTGHSNKSIHFYLADDKNAGGAANLNIRIWPKTKTPPSWNGLIEALLVQWPAIGAWQWNRLYGAWQNTVNPDIYTRNFGDIPANIEFYVIPGDGIAPDTHRIKMLNAPGRRKNILWGVDFRPTAEMWLGEHFWQYAKCTKDEAMAADFFLDVRDTPDFLYLKSWREAFTRPDGEQGRQQQRIWKLFFHEDCEWPPGSGGISDEPMYGPPELMPASG